MNEYYRVRIIRVVLVPVLILRYDAVAKFFIQWESSFHFHWKLCLHWLKKLLIAVVIQGLYNEICISISHFPILFSRCGQSDPMVTLWNGNIFRITGPLCGETTGHRSIPLIKASDGELWCPLWSAPEQRLSKQSRRRWFETPSRSLWRHCNTILDMKQPHLSAMFSHLVTMW